MEKIRFGKTGLEVSRVSLGTWPYSGPNFSGKVSVGWSGHDDDLALAAMKECYNQGINHWDSADVYGNGNSEKLIGKVFSEVPRQEIILTSKVGYDKENYPKFYHPDLIRSHLERSLTNLKTDYLDIYYMHHSNFGKPSESLDDVIELFHRFKEEGKIRFIGLSDWNHQKIYQVIDRVKPDVVQPFRCAPEDDYRTSDLKKYIETHDLGVAFFSPLRHGLLLGKYDTPQTFPEGDYRTNIGGFRDQKTLDRIKEIAKEMKQKFSDSPQPLLHGLLNYLLSDSPTACCLLGLRNPDQVKAATQIGSAISDEEAQFVREIYSGLEQPRV